VEAVVKKAYAKINLTLDVTGRRDDGYHTVLSVMQLVDIYDTVTVETHEGKGILLRSGAPYIPCDNRNSAWKAAQAFFRYCRMEPRGLRIAIDKRIPVGAGLGGGSADAAAVLHALNELYDMAIPADKLLEIGADVGADVPFCIMGGTALAEGIGDKLRPLRDMPDCRIVICKPPYSCSTPALYERFDLHRVNKHPDTEGFLSALEEGNLDQMCKRLFNVFENLIPEHSREIFEIKDSMFDSGALGASMTGTGSAIFGIFINCAEAAAARDKLLKVGYDVRLSKPRPGL
jgi:4-diphosphocytidyl-2-C-methyl-D-erythritol kinase